MKLTKILISLLLAGCMIFAVAACTAEKEPEEPETTTTTAAADDSKPSTGDDTTAPDDDTPSDGDDTPSDDDDTPSDDDDTPDGLPEISDSGTWDVDGSTYTLSATRGRDHTSFNNIPLGVTDQPFTVSADIVVNGNPTDSFANDAGFLVAVEDLNEDGMIREGQDYYYLIEIDGSGNVLIDRNTKGWNNANNGFGRVSTGAKAGDTVTLTVSYNPENSTFTVTAGEMTKTWTDPEPFTSGTLVTLASKQGAGNVYENVSFRVLDPATDEIPGADLS